jgi:hypothetical protein
MESLSWVADLSQLLHLYAICIPFFLAESYDVPPQSTVPMYKTTRCHNPEYRDILCHDRKNLILEMSGLLTGL